MPISSKIKVNLGENSYDIHIGKGLLNNAGELISSVVPQNSKIFIITDENTSKLFSRKLKKSLLQEHHEITLPAGEKTKSFANVEKILSEIFPHKPERNSTLVALGGGVIGDITGFAASVLLRGVNFIQIPTTLLSMVDSSVGGKTGVNCKFGKNLIGSFYQPKIVIADTDTLKTLPKREFLAGYAEVVKYGLINNYKFFEFLEYEKTFSKLEEMIKISCESKAEIVSKDEREGGVRALLNLGHTFGHALEALGKYDGSLLHGEAVGIGMVLAFQFSEHLGICNKGEAERVQKMLKNKGLKTQISDIEFKKPTKITTKKIIDLMYQDKKVSDSKLTLILAEKIGKSFVKKDVSEKSLKEFLEQII